MQGRGFVKSALFVAWSGLFVMPSFSGGVAILEPLITDNGDHDGFADSRETVTIRLKLENTTEQTLTGLEVHLTTEDYDLACVTSPTIVVGDLQPGETRITTDGFEFVVADIDRGSLGLDRYDDFSVEFDLTATTHPSALVYPNRLRLDLDLNVAGGVGANTFVENFENGMGQFQVENLDSGLSGLAESDDYRCQYFDPDWVNSNIYGDPLMVSECYIAASPLHADAIWWGLSGPETSPGGGRGFTGFHSLFYGIDLGEPLGFTTPMGTLEAVVSGQPIHLGWNGVVPTLSIMHQVALIDGRVDVTQDDPQATGVPFPEPGSAEVFDRAVLMVQLADDQNQAIGNWFKLDPYINTHDQVATTSFPNCMFDPIDDGTIEDDFFEPTDPARRYGPSTTCYPELAYANIGETAEPFDPDHLGFADGPGQQGIWGVGTWINSRFDLSRFRGRSIRLRLLVSAMQIVPNEDWEEYLDWNPNPGDNGWWIDDITVTNALNVPATLALDSVDNSGLPGPPPLADPDGDAVCTASGDNCPGVSNPDQADGDLDGSGTACDCDDGNPLVYPDAVEINDGLDNQCPGDSGYGLVDEISGTAGFLDPDDKNVFAWPEQVGAVRYDVVRARSKDFTDHCTLFLSIAGTEMNDSTPVFPGELHHYLVRASFPNEGSWGANSVGEERGIPCDP